MTDSKAQPKNQAESAVDNIPNQPAQENTDAQNTVDLAQTALETDKKTAHAPKTKTSKKRKKIVHKLLRGRAQAHIKSTYNNTIVSISDQIGNIICQASAGRCGFKGPKKSTPYAAGIIVKSLFDKMKASGVRELDVFVKGVGMGREAAIRAFGAGGITVASIKDVTPIPHNGCRAKKPRKP